MTTTSPEHEAYLRQRYREERAKRLRPEGNAQYVEPTGRFAHYRDDPYAERVEREPITEDVELLVIGAGFGGLVVAAKAKEAGVVDVRLVDGAGDVGGVWYWNRYPGAMCDTAAMIYLPLLEETGAMPSEKYTHAPEIHAHAQRIARHYDLYEGALFSTEVTGLRWDEERRRWIVTTDRGDTLAARFVAAGTGPLHRPKLPGIPGIQEFAGPAFHTSRWEYETTGGDARGAPMVRLANKRVGIIGTGATAVQCIPVLVRDSGHLTVFQRTPSSVDVRNNVPIDAEWFASLAPGWQDAWRTNFVVLQTGGFADEDLVQDGWTDISVRIRDRVVAELGAGAEFGPEAFRRAYADSDDEKMDEIRARVAAVVEDAETAAALKPWYRQLCKRPCFHDEYLAAFNRPNVTLVDTDGRGVSRIDASGVWVGDRHVELDVLVFASGFEVGTPYHRRSGFDVIGRGGIALSEAWEDGMRSLHGLHVADFPNFFVIGIAQAANLVSNITHNYVEAAETIASVLARAAELGACVVETTKEAEQAWVELVASSPQTILADPDCTPGYYNNEGAPIGERELRNAARYPEGAVAYFAYIDRWRRSGTFEGLVFTP